MLRSRSALTIQKGIGPLMRLLAVVEEIARAADSQLTIPDQKPQLQWGVEPEEPNNGGAATPTAA